MLARGATDMPHRRLLERKDHAKGVLLHAAVLEVLDEPLGARRAAVELIVGQAERLERPATDGEALGAQAGLHCPHRVGRHVGGEEREGAPVGEEAQRAVELDDLSARV